MSDKQTAEAPGHVAIDPRPFSMALEPGTTDAYLDDPTIRALATFFHAKGLAAIKEEDRLEQWYDDWLAYQAKHRLYATVLSPKAFSTLGGEFDLLRYARFLEVFAYFSPAHGYSLQVTFLGLFSILMGSNIPLKQEAVAALEAGGVLAFGVSEKDHGADLLGNQFTVTATRPGRFVANGVKYYIGNANSAAIISTLARRQEQSQNAPSNSEKRSPFILVALRPKGFKGSNPVRKIRTLGVRAGFVGEFGLKDHALTERDVIAEGRAAWDAVLGTVTLGKFFLGFGSIGICEHAFEEASAHLQKRILYGKPAIEMPHLRSAMSQAYARLAAMKLYAFRALDYLRAAGERDRRYLLFNAVQKARVSTEGVKVIALLSECIGAKGFESDTYFEMALRDILLIPGLEGSTHINLALAARFIPRYFALPDRNLRGPPSLALGQAPAGENPYLMEARTGGINAVAFPRFLNSYRPLMSIPNVRLFAKAAQAFAAFLHGLSKQIKADDAELSITLGKLLATIAYGQLVAENATLLAVPPQMISAVFHLLLNDLSVLALELASNPALDDAGRMLIGRVAAVPQTVAADWEHVFNRVANKGTFHAY